MIQSDLYDGIMNICKNVFSQGPEKKEIKDLEIKMRIYAHTAFIAALHEYGVSLKDIAKYLGINSGNVSRMNRCYEARLQKDKMFKLLMTEFNKQKKKWEKNMWA